MIIKRGPMSLYYYRRPTRWTNGIGAELPDAYRKFWREWKEQQAAPVHYIEKKGVFQYNEEYGTIEPIQNVPIPLKYPEELNKGIWGGEAVVQGFVKKSKYRRRVARFWVPNLHRSVVYSEVLNTYMSTIITNRTVLLINEHYGFDHYLLKTPACDLRSELALGIKRKILIALADKTLYPDDPVKREEIYAQYQQYLQSYTREEIEWYGLSWVDACKKWIAEKEKQKEVIPMKLQFRSQLIAQLKEAKIQEAQNVEVDESGSATWMAKINPFAKNPKVQ